MIEDQAKWNIKMIQWMEFGIVTLISKLWRECLSFSLVMGSLTDIILTSTSTLNRLVLPKINKLFNSKRLSKTNLMLTNQTGKKFLPNLILTNLFMILKYKLTNLLNNKRRKRSPKKTMSNLNLHEKFLSNHSIIYSWKMFIILLFYHKT